VTTDLSVSTTVQAEKSTTTSASASATVSAGSDFWGLGAEATAEASYESSFNLAVEKGTSRS